MWSHHIHSNQMNQMSNVPMSTRLHKSSPCLEINVRLASSYNQRLSLITVWWRPDSKSEQSILGQVISIIQDGLPWKATLKERSKKQVSQTGMLTSKKWIHFSSKHKMLCVSLCCHTSTVRHLVCESCSMMSPKTLEAALRTWTAGDAKIFRVGIDGRKPKRRLLQARTIGFNDLHKLGIEMLWFSDFSDEELKKQQLCPATNGRQSNLLDPEAFTCDHGNLCCFITESFSPNIKLVSMFSA